eukprot:3345368-Rhodomonas_salina.2
MARTSPQTSPPNAPHDRSRCQVPQERGVALLKGGVFGVIPARTKLACGHCPPQCLTEDTV